MNTAKRVRVLMACPGLGRVIRGFETFTRECFDVLSADPRLDVTLFKGAGAEIDRERKIWCLGRDGSLARQLGVLVRRDGYYVEQATFTLTMLSDLARRPPDVVFLSDGTVANLLWRWRRLTRGRFRLLLSNGGPLGPPSFPRFEHVHQVLSSCFEESIQEGRAPARMTLLPYGFRIAPKLDLLDTAGRSALRRRLGLPDDRPVVLTVGAINCSHKRMDYVVREVAALPEPRPFLIMLGQRDAESPAVLAAAASMLGPTGHQCESVSPDKVADYYDAADVFVLASLKEGFGRVLVEAAARGLPCLAAERSFAREVLGSSGYLADVALPGALAHRLRQVLAEQRDAARAAAQHAEMYERFSWDKLAPQYAAMIMRCAACEIEVEVAKDERGTNSSRVSQTRSPRALEAGAVS